MPDWVYTPEHPQDVLANALEQAAHSNEPIKLAYATVQGDVDLSAINYPCPFQIRNTRFTGHVNLTDARFARSVDLTTCTFEKGIRLTGAKIDGYLRLFDVNFQSDNANNRCADLRHLCVSCDLVATGIQCDVPFVANGLHVNGGADFSSTATRQSIFRKGCDLAHATIGGQLSLSGVLVDERLTLQGATIDADLLLHSKANHRPTVHDAWLPFLRVKGTLNLSGANVTTNLNLQCAVVEGPSLFRVMQGHRPQVGGSIMAIHATFKGLLDLEAVTVSNVLDLHGATLGNGICCYPSECGASPEIGNEQQVGPGIGKSVELDSSIVSGGVRFNGTTIRGSLSLYAAQVRGDISCKPMSGHRTVITGDATFAHAKVVGDISLSGAEVRGDVDIEAATVDGSVHGTVCEANRLLAGRDFSVVGTNISGQLNVAGAKIERLFNLDNLSCRGGLICGTSQSNPVQRTEIGGDVQLNATTIAGIAECDGLLAGGLQVANSIIQGELRCKVADGFRAELGRCSIVGTRITGQVTFSGAHIRNTLQLLNSSLESGFVSVLDGGQRAEIETSVLIVGGKVLHQMVLQGVRIGQKLQVLGTEIKGDFDFGDTDDVAAEIGWNAAFDDSVIDGTVRLDGISIGQGLSFNRTSIKGDLVCSSSPRDGFSVGGDFSLFNARIGRNFVLAGAIIASNLELDGTSVLGQVLVGNGHRPNRQPDYTEIRRDIQGFRAEFGGGLRLDGVRILRNIQLRQATLGKDFTYPFSHDIPAMQEGTIDLSDCHAKVVEVDGRMCPQSELDLAGSHIARLTLGNRLPQKVSLRGAKIDDLDVPNNDYARFLAADQEFSKDTYIAVEKQLRDKGDNDGGDKVHCAMRRRSRRRKHRLSRLLDWVFLDGAIGYGTALWRPVIFLIVLLLASWWVFREPSSVQDANPVGGKAAAHPTAWSSTDSLWTAIRVVVPGMSMAKKSDYVPSSEFILVRGKPIGVTYEVYSIGVAAIGSILALVIVGNLTGLLRKIK